MWLNSLRQHNSPEGADPGGARGPPSPSLQNPGSAYAYRGHTGRRRAVRGGPSPRPASRLPRPALGFGGARRCMRVPHQNFQTIGPYVIFQNFAGMFPSSSTIVCCHSSTAVLLYFHNLDGYFVASSIRPIRHNPLRFKMAAPNISEA